MLLKAPGPHRREGGCHERVCVHWCPVLGRINIILVLLLLPACTSEAAPSPSWRELEIHAPKLDPSSHFRLRRHSGIQLSFFIHTVRFNTRSLRSRARSNGCTWHASSEKCSQYDLIYSCCSTRPATHTSEPWNLTWEANRGTALSILTSIGSDMHECRLACRPMYMHHTHWSAGHPNNVRSRFAKHQG